ncbi:extracellular solute-binding protein [Paenibacillus sp. J31TS4]|uniref:extracellular solute-binding protein n=1 Tax=Paenibacillus sp. J31TS4 TaxID=2807195 RepID=UPI0020BE160B|nr:extracellular solute-binding protein [Paenibacillus sp. J31TS4]
MKKWTAALVTSAVTASLVAGCGGGGDASGDSGKKGEAQNSNLNATGFPIVKEPIKLTFFTGKAATTANNWNETVIWKEYAKMTNINVDFQLVPFDNLTEKRNLSLASGDYPDAFHTTRMTNTDLVKYGSQGTFIKLNDLIDKYAPNLKKILDADPSIRKGITMADGNIYAFPLIYDQQFTSALLGAKLWYKKDWLDALGMKEPTTLDEFYEYLKAVKNTDLNKNGKADEIGYGGVGYADLLNKLKGSFGLMNRGTAQPNVDMDPKTNELRFVPTAPEYKEMLQYVNKLTKEGLIEKEITTIKSNQFYAKGAEGVYGSMVTTSPYTLMKQTTYVGMPMLKGPNGQDKFTAIRSPLVQTGAFVITDKNKNPEATVRWMDYFYSEEGNKMFFMGIKDQSYTETADGKVQYTDEITKNPQGLTLEQAVVKYVTWPGGSYPGIVRQKFFAGAEALPESIEAAKKVEPNLIKDIWPPFSFTDAENEKLITLQNDIHTYVTEMETKFITGTIPFTEWDNYVATIKKMGVDEYLKIYKAGYDRYKK